jgi:hypothetical protein
LPSGPPAGSRKVQRKEVDLREVAVDREAASIRERIKGHDQLRGRPVEERTVWVLAHQGPIADGLVEDHAKDRRSGRGCACRRGDVDEEGVVLATLSEIHGRIVVIEVGVENEAGLVDVQEELPR